MKLNFKTIIVVFLVGLLGASIGTYGILTLYQDNKKIDLVDHQDNVIINKVEYTGVEKTDYTKTIEKVYNTVVEITCTVQSSQSGYYYFFGGAPSTSTAAGSGVVFTEDGYIVTNQHVIDGAVEDTITVKLYDGKEYSAKVIGSDTRTDLAVLKIDADNLEYASFADSSQLMMGQDVIAIGNPLGLGISCSNGIVSALEKEIYINKVYLTVIQTNAAVNAGNSGGGLFDIQGNIVGIVNAKKSSSSSLETSVEGMGYAIPSNTVTRIINDIVDHGYVQSRPALGVRVYTDGTYNVNGVIISDVVPGGSADIAGLKANDIITRIDNTDIISYADLSKFLDSKAVGDKVTVIATRADKSKEFKVTLQESTNN